MKHQPHTVYRTDAIKKIIAVSLAYLNCRDKGEMLTTFAMPVERNSLINVPVTQSTVSSEIDSIKISNVHIPALKLLLPFTAVEQCTDKALGEHAQFCSFFFPLLSDPHLLSHGSGVWLQEVHHRRRVRRNQLSPGIIHDLYHIRCTSHSMSSNVALVSVNEVRNMCIR